MSDNLTYKKEVRKLQAQWNTEKKRVEAIRNKELNKLREKYDIPSRNIATFKDLISMIGNVLETGESGTITIRNYAKLTDRTDEWKKDIARSKAGKRFKKALYQYEESKVILSMKANQVYDEGDILNNTITGALTKLSKQIKVSKIIDDLRNEVATLKQHLADKGEGKDWKNKAQELRDAGMSLSEIGKALGVSKSAVGKYTRGKK